MFSAGHQALVDHLCRIVPPGINVHALLHDGVGAGAQSLADLVPTRLDRRWRAGRVGAVGADGGSHYENAIDGVEARGRRSAVRGPGFAPRAEYLSQGSPWDAIGRAKTERREREVRGKIVIRQSDQARVTDLK